MRKRRKRVLQRQRDSLIKLSSACAATSKSLTRLGEHVGRLKKIKFLVVDDVRD